MNDVAERLLTEAVAKVVNKSTTMAKIVAIVKIVAFAAVAIASAAMAIAASIASGGAAAVLILGAIVTGAQALGNIVGQYMDVYPSLEKSTKTLAQVMAPLIGEIKVAEMLDEGDPKDLLKNNPKLQLLFKPGQNLLVEMQVWQNKLSTQIALMEQENKRYAKKIAKRSTLKKEDFDEKDWKKLEIEGKKVEAEFDHFTKQLPQLAKKLAMVKKFTEEVEALVGKQDLDTGEWDSLFKSLKTVVKEKWEIAKLTVSSPDAMLDLAVEASKG